MQLLSYRLAMSHPPILVVCDRFTVRIRIQFTGHPAETFSLPLRALDQPASQALLRRILLGPESFRPKKTSCDTTRLAVCSRATLAKSPRKCGAAKAANAEAWQPQADDGVQFLSRCLFCFLPKTLARSPSAFQGWIRWPLPVEGAGFKVCCPLVYAGRCAQGAEPCRGGCLRVGCRWVRRWPMTRF